MLLLQRKRESVDDTENGHLKNKNNNKLNNNRPSENFEQLADAVKRVGFEDETGN